MYDPACPIYGTGAVAISLIMKAALAHEITLSLWQIFLIAFVGSAGLEYITAWGLEKLFHAAWWDYSKLPFNLHGRIYFFRDRDEHRKTLKNRYLTRLKGLAINRKRSAESDE